jgi:hypothetical protein
MSPAARSIQVFAVYLLLLGLVLVVSPNMLLALFGIPATGEVWIRVVGMLVCFLGVYYWEAARANLRTFFAWTVPVRLSVPVFFGAFVLLGMAPPVLLLFGAVDAAAALWTWFALRRG